MELRRKYKNETQEIAAEVSELVFYVAGALMGIHIPQDRLIGISNFGIQKRNNVYARVENLIKLVIKDYEEEGNPGRIIRSTKQVQRNKPGARRNK